MASHASELTTLAQTWHAGVALAGLSVGGAVAPDSAGHVVAGAQQDVAEVGAPGQLADGVLVTAQQSQVTGFGVADVEGTDHGVDSAGGDDVWTVLVPVMSEAFGGWERVTWLSARQWYRAMDRDQVNEVV